jgi:hypothetical protein
MDCADKKAFPSYNFEKDLMDTIMFTLTRHNADAEGIFHLYFMIDTFGQICNINIIKGISESFDKEIIEKSLYKMPKWEPAEYKKKKAESIIFLTIRIYIKE